MMGNWMHGIGGGAGWIFFLVSGLFKIAVLVAVIWLIVWAVKRFTGRPVSTPGAQPTSAAAAIEILQARYARGEVTREQYLEIMEDLKK